MKAHTIDIAHEILNEVHGLAGEALIGFPGIGQRGMCLRKRRAPGEADVVSRSTAAISLFSASTLTSCRAMSCAIISATALFCSVTGSLLASIMAEPSSVPPPMPSSANAVPFKVLLKSPVTEAIRIKLARIMKNHQAA